MRAEIIATLSDETDFNGDLPACEHIMSVYDDARIEALCAACGHDSDLVAASIRPEHGIDMAAIARLGIRSGVPDLYRRVESARRQGRILRIMVEH